MIRFRSLPVVALAFAPFVLASQVRALQVEARGQASEIGLYPPDVQAIRRMAGPVGALSIPAADDQANAARKAWGRISKKGREFLLREPGLALVIVNSDGKWLYRSTAIANIRSVNDSSEPLRKQDADDLAEVLDSPVCQHLRDFYEGRLLSALQYSPNGSRGLGSPLAEAYGSLLSRVQGAGATPEENDWLRRIVGFEILGLDDKTRQVLRTDPTYGPDIIKSIVAAEETGKQQLEAVAQASSGRPGPHPHFNPSEDMVGLDDLAFHLPDKPGDATLTGTVEISEVNGRQILRWTNPAGTVFVTGKTGEIDLPLDLTKENLRSVLQTGKAKMYVSSPASLEIFEVKAERPSKNRLPGSN
jgi:hypothetical protein